MEHSVTLYLTTGCIKPIVNYQSIVNTPDWTNAVTNLVFINCPILGPRVIQVHVLGVPGFNGCMRRVTLQGNPFRLSTATGGYGIVPCYVPPCDDHRCTSGSTCRPDVAASDGYVCICPFGVTGTCHIVTCADVNYVVINSLPDVELPLCKYSFANLSCEWINSIVT